MENRPLTTKEAAEYLSVHHWILLRYIRQGLLKAYKLGSGKNARWRIMRSDLDDFLKTRCNIKDGE